MSQAGGAGEATAGAAKGAEMRRYSGVIDAFVNIPKQEGIGALYRGFWPLAARKVVWTVCYFMAYEHVLFAVSGEYAN